MLSRTSAAKFSLLSATLIKYLLVYSIETGFIYEHGTTERHFPHTSAVPTSLSFSPFFRHMSWHLFLSNEASFSKSASFTHFLTHMVHVPLCLLRQYSPLARSSARQAAVLVNTCCSVIGPFCLASYATSHRSRANLRSLWWYVYRCRAALAEIRRWRFIDPMGCPGCDDCAHWHGRYRTTTVNNLTGSFGHSGQVAVSDKQPRRSVASVFRCKASGGGNGNGCCLSTDLPLMTVQAELSELPFRQVPTGTGHSWSIDSTGSAV